MVELTLQWMGFLHQWDTELEFILAPVHNFEGDKKKQDLFPPNTPTFNFFFFFFFCLNAGQTHQVVHSICYPVEADNPAFLATGHQSLCKLSLSRQVSTCPMSSLMTCDVWRTPVEGALSYAETASSIHHCGLQHLLPTCAENRFQTVLFLSVGHNPSLLWLFTQAFIILQLLDVEVMRRNHLPFRRQQRQGPSSHHPPPYVFSTLSIALQTDNDELFVFNALF